MNCYSIKLKYTLVLWFSFNVFINKNGKRFAKRMLTIRLFAVLFFASEQLRQSRFSLLIKAKASVRYLLINRKYFRPVVI